MVGSSHCAFWELDVGNPGSSPHGDISSQHRHDRYDLEWTGIPVHQLLPIHCDSSPDSMERMGHSGASFLSPLLGESKPFHPGILAIPHPASFPVQNETRLSIFGYSGRIAC